MQCTRFRSLYTATFDVELIFVVSLLINVSHETEMITLEQKSIKSRNFQELCKKRPFE